MNQRIDDYLAEKFRSTDLTDIHLREEDHPWIREADVLTYRDEDPLFERGELITWLKRVRYHEDDPITYIKQMDGDDSFGGTAGACRFRANAYLGNGLLNIALRRLNENIMAFPELNIPDLVLDLADRSKGLFLVVGGTGSGKTTTLAAVLNHINETRACHILTAEDPIEYLIRSKKSRVTQREIGTGKSGDTSSYAKALRAALREDPDVAMVGEIRDRETMDVALAAAETGHMVFGTLHTNGAYQTIERIASMYEGSERDMALGTLASVLTGVLAQVKLPGTDGKPVIATEILVPTSSVRQSIRMGKVVSVRQEMETGSSDGQLLLNNNLTELVRAGRITREDAMYHSIDPDKLERMV